MYFSGNEHIQLKTNIFLKKYETLLNSHPLRGKKDHNKTHGSTKTDNTFVFVGFCYLQRI